MNPLRIRVVALGEGYLAKSSVPCVTAFGATAEEAAENARLMAMAVYDAFGARSYPETLIVKIDCPCRSAIAMQSMHQPFSLSDLAKDAGSYYFDTLGNSSAVH